MRSVTFKSVLNGVATRMGLEPEANLQLNQATALTEYITDRLGKYWQRAAWPEWTTAELRQYREDWRADTSYAAGAELYYGPQNAYYRSLQADNLNHLPTEAAWWEPASELDTYVALEQGWAASKIGEVWGVWQDDPRKTKRPRKVSWWLGPEGVWVDTALRKVYVEFSALAPRFTTALWEAAKAYVPGDLVYYDADGDCYEALLASTGVVPTSNPASWQRQAFPAILARTVKLAAIADALREDENLSKASAWDAQAEDAYQDAMERAWPAMRTQPSYSMNR